MSLVSWNVRGLCNPKKDAILRNMIVKHKIEMIGVVETKLTQFDKTRIVVILGFSNMDDIGCKATESQSGGLNLIWNTDSFTKSMHYQGQDGY